MTSALTESAKTQSPFSYLYTRVALNHLGETSAIIISTLISYGRLTAKDISIKSKLTLKQVKIALVSLIQLNCIQYWKENSSKSVFYTFNDRGIITLLHAGDIIARIKSQYGEKAAELVQNIIENGNITVKDFISTLSDEQEKYDNMAILVKLFNDGWLHRLQIFNYHPAEDLWNKMYQETLKNTPRSATTSEIKRVAEATEKTKIKFNDLFLSGNESKDVFIVESGIHQLKSSITLGFNLSRFEKHLRSRALSDMAKSRLGLLTGFIYEQCCSLIEQKSADLRHRYQDISGLITNPEEERVFLSSVENALVDSKMTVFTIRDLMRHLPPDLDLRNSILTQNFLKPAKRVNVNGTDQPHKKIKLEDGSAITEMDIEFESDFHAENGDGPLSMTLVAEHLRLLTFNTVPFLFEVAPGSYTIPFLQLSKHVKQFHYEALIKTTMGTNALRILKCIKAMKLVDEKAISNSVLLKERTVKNELYHLINMNVIEIQEVPRSADRAASKTFYLFRHKDASSYRFLSHALAFNMGDILTNIESFKAEHKILLEKCEREDVKGHEEELLLESELKTLRDLQLREISNIGRFNRVKWLFTVFGTL
ncbi:putative DNA-directed RNA polymerase III subunit [Clavispora lusitaniae]|uniref:DNA-directed RNA polymerase III subunit RPC3 n=3 Tax=Clavispora lusitaniae TaxID=36911 RepID=C4XYL2_CLAL4|nr:uncharacterized protein CLUG_01035 [Clavispora lusitaniae ATCC 42720]OVF08156.1 putative dNA-directed RNA polymerase III subunit RPC3 [Clavispora lusitaniae]EEQ36912.1 hypothetical protein CLUG_01035 [Clavispora lusitaniae ATCC 42720]QFZ25938.1 putative DNA-directed RNA polymerase III subunit [Clavispora lusitaniae]QFZ30759.1 putative DNA-directed RNA polymerase III subunit [Clavispora lusitaniae]QFZ36427.1 putative DNA-directed RNA polymerase III subunit [Clavispora lusitaniae]